MKYNHLKKIVFFVFLLNHLGFTQKIKELSYPKGYFMFPIRPGKINHLSGSMGDLRANHFHGGLDIKTEQKEGLPVYAAAGGYISEIRVSTGGYGNVIFIKHPNGYTTVYGHLKTFEGEIGEYARIKRYSQQSFEINIQLNPSELNINKGDVIALSGNTGGSGGPHLHFEIRDELNHILNPLYFGFNEINDNLPPIIQSVLVKPLTIDSRVNNAFGRQYFYPKYAKNTYFLPDTIYADGQIGLEILANDKMNYNNNIYGISCIEMHVNDQESFYYHLEKIPVEDSRDINIHVDYPLEKTIGKKYQKLFIADGNNNLPVYKAIENSGRLNIEQGKVYNVEIKLWDSYENLSVLKFIIFGKKAQPNLIFDINKKLEKIDTQIDENTLIVTLENCKSAEQTCNIGVDGISKSIPLSYIKNNNAYYLYDLRDGLPQFVEVGENQKNLSLKQVIFACQDKAYEIGNFNIKTQSKSNYDTLYLDLAEYTNGFQIGQPTIPLKQSIDVSYKNKIAPLNSEKTAIYITNNEKSRLLNSSWSSNMVTFTTRELGDFSILTDVEIPEIKLLGKSEKYFAFRIKDDLSGIKDFRAEINGNFVLTDYDYKKAMIWSIPEVDSTTFSGKLILKVTDNAGNTAEYETEMDEPMPFLKKSKKKVGKKTKNAVRKTKLKKSTKNILKSKNKSKKRKK